MNTVNNKKIILSFDLEFWSSTRYLKKYLPDLSAWSSDYLKESVLPVLDLLKKHKTKATFFVTGEVMEKYPGLIKEIHAQGNEIALHSYFHQSLKELTPRKFRNEIKKSLEIMENIVGKKPKGFRAPYFSLDNQTRWILPILTALGFKYDSSIFPLKTPFYGVNRAPNNIYPISFKEVSKVDSNSSLIEIPMTFYRFFGLKIPIAGGVYFRLMPLFLFKRMLKKIQKKRISILYFHPHELYKDIPVVKQAPWLKKKLKYYGIKKSLEKFEELLKSFEFDSVENILGI